MVVVTGPPGVGKTRLGWELEKYVDGLAETVFWHRGRCPTFGEHTAYWALTEMVRARLGIAEDDELAVVEEKRRAVAWPPCSPTPPSRRWWPTGWRRCSACLPQPGTHSHGPT